MLVTAKESQNYSLVAPAGTYPSDGHDSGARDGFNDGRDILSGHSRILLAQFRPQAKSKRGLTASEPLRSLQQLL